MTAPPSRGVRRRAVRSGLWLTRQSPKRTRPLRCQIHHLIPVRGDETLVTVAEADDAPPTVWLVSLRTRPRMTSLRPGHSPPQVTIPARVFDGSKEDLASRTSRLEAGQLVDRTATRLDHAQGVVEEHPITLVDMVFGGLPVSSNAANGDSIRACPNVLTDKSSALIDRSGPPATVTI